MNRREVLATIPLTALAVLPMAGCQIAPAASDGVPTRVPVIVRCTGSGFHIDRCSPEEAQAWIEVVDQVDRQLVAALRLKPSIERVGPVTMKCRNCGGTNDGRDFHVEHLPGCPTVGAQA